jgi:hypothetical protein
MRSCSAHYHNDRSLFKSDRLTMFAAEFCIAHGRLNRWKTFCAPTVRIAGTLMPFARISDVTITRAALGYLPTRFFATRNSFPCLVSRRILSHFAGSVHRGFQSQDAPSPGAEPLSDQFATRDMPAVARQPSWLSAGDSNRRRWIWNRPHWFRRAGCGWTA